MSSWEDGPEYAPLERPQVFAEPYAAPLDQAPPYTQLAALAPKERPVFADPPVPVAPLVTLVPPTPDLRDPEVPFDVVSSTLTSPDTTESAWGATHWNPPSGPPAGAPAPNPFPTAPPPLLVLPSFGPTTGPMTGPTSGGPTIGGPAPTLADLPGPPPGPGSFPAPGTPQWFGPGPVPPAPVGPVTVTAKQVVDIATPGLLIVLGIGALIYPVAPIMLLVARGLSARVTVATDLIRRVFTVAVSVVVAIALLAALTNDGAGFAAWWRTTGLWSLLGCWVLLVLTVVLIIRALREGAVAAPRRATWG